MMSKKNLNMSKFVNNILTFVINSIFGSSHSTVLLIIGVHIRYILGIPVGRGRG